MSAGVVVWGEWGGRAAGCKREVAGRGLGGRWRGGGTEVRRVVGGSDAGLADEERAWGGGAGGEWGCEGVGCMGGVWGRCGGEAEGQSVWEGGGGRGKVCVWCVWAGQGGKVPVGARVLTSEAGCRRRSGGMGCSPPAFLCLLASQRRTYLIHGTKTMLRHLIICLICHVPDISDA